MDNENSRNFNVTAKATASQKENYRKKAEQEGLSLSEWIVTVLDLYIEGHEAKGEPKQELPKTEVDWSKFPKATQLKLKMQKLHKKIINGFQEEPINYPNALSRSLNNRVVKKEEPKQDRTCTNNCSVVCGECQIFKPKQETLETIAERILAENGVYDEDMILSDTFSKVVNSMVVMAKSQDVKASFKHEFKVIPKEEVLANRSNAYQFIDFDKQETLEKAICRIKSENEHYIDEDAFELGAKWQQERMYSEEEVYHILCEHTAELFKGSKMTLTEWFDKVKKK